jgi:hypothetical protein
MANQTDIDPRALATFEANAKVIRDGVAARVVKHKLWLADWAELNTERGEGAAISIALLETAIGREIDIFGEADAR